jgi:hypothetical protein
MQTLSPSDATLLIAAQQRDSAGLGALFERYRPRLHAAALGADRVWFALEEKIDRMALRDWVWTAISSLPETLRVTAMLRYFGSFQAYDEIAAILGIPVGTVRSRLSQVKTKLADALLQAGSITARTASRRGAGPEPCRVPKSASRFMPGSAFEKFADLISIFARRVTTDRLRPSKISPSDRPHRFTA